MEEREYVYPVEIDMLMRGENNEITPVGYERMVIDVIERHFAINKKEESEQTLLEKGVSWVVVSTNIELKNKVDPKEKLYGRTWVVEKTGPIFRREVGIYHEDGSIAIGAATFFVLIDREKRRILRNPEEYVCCNVGHGEKLTQGESRIKFKPDGFALTEKLNVRPSWIDAVGHVNNVRYLEMVYDALSDDEQADMPKLKRLEAYFMNELHKGEIISLNRLSYNGITTVAIMKSGEGKPAFVARLFFS